MLFIGSENRFVLPIRALQLLLFFFQHSVTSFKSQKVTENQEIEFGCGFDDDELSWFSYYYFTNYHDGFDNAKHLFHPHPLVWREWIWNQFFLRSYSIITASLMSLQSPSAHSSRVLIFPNIQDGFFDWSALKNDLSVRLHVNPLKEVLSVRIS